MNRVIACIDSSPCIDAVAEAAVWVARQTQRELVLLQILDYYPASYHLGEISGVIGFESNAMLLKELAELEQKQSELALDYSNNLLKHISEQIEKQYGLTSTKIQEKGDFLEQSFNILNENDVVIIGRVGERAAEKNKPIGSNVENSAYPVGNCAEASAISAMISSKGKKIIAIAVTGYGNMLCTPCGGCRQRIREFSEPNTPVIIGNENGIQKVCVIR